MAIHTAHYDIIPDKLPDEILVYLSQKARPDIAAEARQELRTRLYPWINRKVAALARPWHLSKADLRDACQQAFFWHNEAIQRFDTDKITEPRHRTLRSFCASVLHDRFLDWVRRGRKDYSHYVHGRKAAESLENASNEDVPLRH